INRPANAARFQIPAAVKARYDATLAFRGARTTEWLMTFAQLGFPKDGRADTITPRVVAPGATLLQGIPNNSMIVEQSDGVVVVEGARSDFRAEAIISYIRRTYPGKPIKFVTGSHHHADHAGGMRPFVALGATAIVGEDAAALFRRQFADRSSRLLPDRLDRSSRAATIRTVPTTGAITIPDAAQPITVLSEPTQHASTTILVYMPTAGVLFVNGDTYTPGGPFGPGAAALEQTLEANAIKPAFIVGGHGGVVTYAAFRTGL